ncbi:MAG: ROK family protein [Myxococcota bacterium]
MRVGIDLGGTKIEAVGMDPMGEVRGKIRVSTPDNYEKVIDSIVSMMGRMEAKVGKIDAVGIGTPGAIDPETGLVKNAYNTALQGRPFAEDIGKRLTLPVRVANDSNCFALSEATDGAGSGGRVVFGVILGTGVGGGVVVDGKLIGGINGIAGEWGHNPLPGARDDERPGPQCTCGRRGCIEAFLSGPALQRDHEERTGDAISAARLAERAEAGDEACLATLEIYGDRLARALGSAINMLDPNFIVLGGGVSQIPEIYRFVRAKWGEYVFSETVKTKLLPNRFGDSSGVRGAAWLWSMEEIQEFRRERDAKLEAESKARAEAEAEAGSAEDSEDAPADEESSEQPGDSVEGKGADESSAT